MQKYVAQNRFMSYTLGMEKTALQERKELDEFMRRLNLLRREFPNVVIDSESGFEAVEVWINKQVDYIPREIEQ